MILNIDQSFKLYKLLDPFVPETIENEDIVDFSSTILDRIIQANEHEKFLHIGMLITNKKAEEILVMDMNEFIPELITTFSENSIYELIMFYRGLNNG